MQTRVENKASLIQQLSASNAEIKSFGVKSLSIFGSFAKDKNIHTDSDIDFLVDFESDEKTYDNFINLSFFLEELLGRKIELVTPQSLSKHIGPGILKEAEVIY